MRNCQEIYKTKSRNLSVNEKLSRKLPNQVQQLECEWEIVKKFTKPSPATWFEIVLIYGIQVEEPKTELKWRSPSPATWVWKKNCQEIYHTNSSNSIWNFFDIWNSGRKAKNRVEMTELKSSNLSVNEKLSRNLPNQVQHFKCEWEIVKKFTHTSPATWFEIVLIYGIQVEKPKTELKWRIPSPANWVWMRNCQETYQTKSSNLSVNEKLSRNLPNQVQQLDLRVFDIWISSQKAKKNAKMTEPKSSNLIVNEKFPRNVTNQVQQLDLKLFWYMEFRSKSRKQSWNGGAQNQQLECEWEIVKKFTKPTPATWFGIVLIYGIQVEKPKTELKWRNPSSATWVWMINCQEIY